MYGDMTFEFILGRMLESIPDNVDKREGSVIYDALAPSALEFANFYSVLNDVTDETFADTAGREMLIRRAAERGIVPYPATYAVVRGGFDAAVPIGARFSLGELRYVVTERDGGATYRMVCESVGSIGNRAFGDLIPIDFISCLTKAEIIELLIPGEDEEDTEHLRKRYFDSLQTQSYGGNIADYRKMALSLQGVGGVKVEPAFNGGGTVKLTVQDYQWSVPSSALIFDIQEAIDPVKNRGGGKGLAPIGHKVTVVPISGVVINISAGFVMAQGWRFVDVKPDLDKILSEYLCELASEWSSSDAVVFRSSQFEVKVLSEMRDRVVDIVGLSIGGCDFRTRAVTLPADSIPLRGDITNVS